MVLQVTPKNADYTVVQVSPLISTHYSLKNVFGIFLVFGFLVV